jgi:GAF domain-containing protein/anti-sigma regulatory factor (Ser/Thr protein kinase)
MADNSLTTSFNLDELLMPIVEHARALIPFDSGGIVIYDPESGLLAPRLYLRPTPDAPLPRLMAVGDGVIGAVAQTRQPLLIGDVTAEAHYVPYETLTRSELAVPIMLDGQLLGVFNAESNQVAAYTEEHLRALEGIARQAAPIIHTAQMYQALSERYAQLDNSNKELLLRDEISHLATSDSPVNALPSMAEKLAQLGGADACALLLWDIIERRAQPLATYRIEIRDYTGGRLSTLHALTGEVVETNQPHVLNRTRGESDRPPILVEYGARAIILLPLTARGRAIGAALLANLRTDKPYTQAQVDKCAAALHAIALAIDTHLLLRDTQARLSETSVLLEIAAIAASSLELDDLLRQVLKLSQQMFGVTCGTFLLYDRSTNTLVPREGAWFGFTHDLDGVRYPVADPGSHTAIVFTSGSPYYTNDLSANRLEYGQLDLNLRNVLLAPLRVQDEPIGVFLVANKPGTFSRNDAHLLSAMGSHVAAAIRNAELLANTRERLRETEALQQIAAITSSTLDLDEILERAVREAAELLDVEGALLMMPELSGTMLVPHERSLYGVARELRIGPLALESVSHIAYVYNTGQPYVSNDPPSDPYIERRNIITHPLNTRNRTLGTISLINRRSGEFEEMHVELTRAIASQIATSTENAQLFAAERARADLMSLINQISQELTATLDQLGLMRKVVNAIHDLLGYETVTIVLLDESSLNVVVEASVSSVPGIKIPEGFTFSINNGIIGRVLRTGDTQFVVDTREDGDFFLPIDVALSGSALAVPLRAGTRTLGAIEAVSMRPNAFQKTDQMAMETLSAQVSIVIENARLWNQAQRRLLEQSIVHQIGQDLTSILDYSELVNAVVQHMTRALDTSLCLLTTYDVETGQLTIDAEYRTSDMPKDVLPPFLGRPLDPSLQNSILRAIQTRRQIILYAEGADPEQQQLAGAGIHAQLTLPMIAGDRVVGCVLWMETRGPREFVSSDVRLAQTLATQAAIAIENARLFRQAQRQAREQTLLRRIAVGLTVMPDMESLLRQLAYETSQALEVDNAVIALRDETGQYPVRASYLLTRTETATALGAAQSRPGLAALFQAIEQGLTVQFNAGTQTTDPTARELLTLVGGQPVSLVLTPITRRGETIGVIEVSVDSASRLFDRQETQLLEAIANQGAIAIDNVSLYEREQRRLRQLEKLQASSRSIAGQLKTGVLLNSIVNEAAAIFDVPAVSLMTRQGGDYYVNRASVGLSERYMRERRVRVRDHQDVITRPFLRAEVRDMDQAQQELIRQEGLTGVLSVALIKTGQQLGILNLYSKGTPRTFTDEERDLAQLFASQAATAYENALLFEALQERAVELAKANKLKSEFLARVSHELRTPMNSINGYSEMLLRMVYGDLNEKQVDRIERILRNGRNLLAIIDDLLDISKIDAGKMELQFKPVNLREELAATIYNLESQVAAQGLYLKLEAPETLPRVRADSMRLKQVVTNLLGNAIKFTKQGGITVRVQVVNDEGVNTVWTSVIDTGIGIKREDQQIIFDEFRQADGSTTREYGGTGLGLAITRKLVEMMSGRIWVESEAGKGSTFTFVLPAVTEKSR